MYPVRSLLLAGTTFLLWSFVQADTCSEVQASFPKIRVARASDSFAFGQLVTDYEASQAEYWNKAAGEQKPTCLIYPQTTQDVSNIINILNQNQERFAVKSGGHMPNKEFNR